MARPPLEVADLIRAAGDAFIERNRHWLRWEHSKVLLAIRRCRTAALGGHLDECTRCGYRATISYNSCRNRHCPKCQIAARERWIAARQRELLPTRYLHVVFTLPCRLAPLVLQNKKILYDLLFRTSAETLSKSRAIRDTSAQRLASSACYIPGAKNSKFIRMFIVSFLPAASRPITPAGFAHEITTFFPRKCCGKFFAASSSTLLSRLSTMASSTSRETCSFLRNPRSSLPGCGHCSGKTGWSI